MSDSEIDEEKIDSETEVKYTFTPMKNLPGYSISNPIFKLRNDVTGHILEGCDKGNSGYKYFKVKKDGEWVHLALHVIVAIENFNYDPKNSEGLEIDHADRNKMNNSVDNIRVVSHSENTKNRDKWKQSPHRYVTSLPTDEKIYREISYRGFDFPGEYYRIGKEFYKKVRENKYLWLRKTVSTNVVTIYIGKNKCLNFTPNSKHLKEELVV
jgi:hypothetical protein